MILTSSQITIGETDYSRFTDAESIQVDDTVIMTHDTAQMNVELAGELPTPAESQEVIWQVGSGREFAGVIQSVQEVDLGTSLQYQLSCVSYEQRLNRHLVTQLFGQQPADQMIKSIIGQFTQGGFTTNNVKPSYTIAPMYFNYSTVSDATKKIADQVQWGFYVDYYKDVHFFPIESFISPLPSNSLYADGHVDTVSWSDLLLTEDGSQKKNRIYVRGFKARNSTPVTLRFTGDGQTKQFSLGYKPSFHKDDVTVTVGGSGYTIKRDMVDGTPDQGSNPGVAYINYYEHMVRFDIAPSSGTQIVVTMYILTDTVIMRNNHGAEAQAAATDDDGSDGRYEYAHTDPSLTNSTPALGGSTIDAAVAKAEQLLYQYAYPQLQAEFTSYINGWRSGQYFYLRSKRRMGGRYDGQIMYVKSVEKTLIRATSGQTVIKHDVKATSTPYLI